MITAKDSPRHSLGIAKPVSTGFTLIELLIVVAIIAILAAIAVPNFLEAQVRSKISRIQSDMRTLSGAMEMYRVDYNTYPSKDPIMADPPDFKPLSSPIAYLTSPAMHDPFASSVQKMNNNPIMVVVSVNTNAYELRKTPPDNGYLIRSYGPDYIDDTGQKNWPWTNGIVYDATYGTKSKGDIVKEVPRKARGLYDPSCVPGPGDPWL